MGWAVFWYCDECNEWGQSDTEVDAMVDKQRHMDAHRGADVPSPAAEEAETDEDTVLTLKPRYVGWAITALLGLLSTHFPDLVGLVPMAALLTVVMTGISDG